MLINEIITESLNEAREGYLYHGMELGKAESVFKTDTMPARWKHTIPGYGVVHGNSFSRNKRLRWGYVTITVDQNKLAQNNKIIPLNSDYVYMHKGGDPMKPLNLGPDVSDRSHTSIYTYDKKKPDEFMQEEFVIGDIKNLHNKIVRIDLQKDTKFASTMSSPYRAEFIHIALVIKKYAEKYNIPFSIDSKLKLKI